MKCQKCGNEMERGIFGPLAGATEWGTGRKLLSSHLLNRKCVTVYRCKACGYLEGYAN
ncbi:hypothetical protein KKG63_01055 [Patescibacteria group bacterium]|nr:hypothetical protein [Patescibacteria group bacterium]